jgi:hypothetical protein
MMSRKTALYLFIALISLPAISLYGEQPSIEVISIDPASPAVLEPGQRLYVKFRYNAGDAEAIQTWVRPEGRNKGCKSHPCSRITDKEGVYEGWFFFDDNAAEIKDIKISMIDCKDKREYICEKSVPVDIKWKAPSDKWPRGYAVPNTDLKIVSIDPTMPAVLKPSEEFKIKFYFDVGTAKSIKIMSWPNNANKCFPFGKTYKFNNVDRGEGAYEYSLVKSKPATVKQVKVLIVNAETERVILEYTFPLDVTWKEPEAVRTPTCTPSSTACQTVECRTPVSPNTTSGQFYLIDAQIAKKYSKKYEGVWAFESKGAGKDDRVIILKSKVNKTGELEFSFIHTESSGKSVFVKSSVDQHRVNAYFTFNGNPIMYSLVREGDLLNGTVCSSKNEAKISLQKLTLSQAVDAIESNLSRMALYNEEVKKLRAETEKQKALFQIQTEEFQKHFAEFAKQARMLQEKSKKLEQQHRNLIEKNNKEAQDMKTKCVKLTATLENTKKAYHKSETLHSVNTARYTTTINDLKARQKELRRDFEKLEADIARKKQEIKVKKDKMYQRSQELKLKEDKLYQSSQAYKEQNSKAGQPKED